MPVDSMVEIVIAPLAHDPRGSSAFAVGAAEKGRPTLMFLTKEAGRLAIPNFAHAVACDGCPPLTDLMARYEKAGGRFLVGPICFDARRLAELGGTVPMWDWIGDEAATTFS
jgi:hypothetical protein